MRAWRRFMLGWVATTAMAASLAWAGRWETDYAKAVQKAKAEGKYLLLDFSGSDWCGWCMKLDDEVFSRSPFKKYVSTNLVCVLVDFPRGKTLSKDESRQNDGLKTQYGIRSFPTIVLLSPDEAKVGMTGYQEGGPEKYVEHLKGMVNAFEKRNADKAAEYRKAREAAAAGGGRQPATALRRPAAGSGVPEDETREARTWTAQSGSTLEASLVSESFGTVTLKKPDGTKVKISLSQLSQQDRDYIAGVATGGKSPPPK